MHKYTCTSLSAQAMQNRLERSRQRHRDFPRDQAVLVRLVKLLHRLFNDRANELLRAHGINHSEYNVLIMLDGSLEGLSAGELADVTSEKPANTTRLVDQLLAKGLVIRQPCDQDRRRLRVLLSPTGEALIETVMPVIAEQLKGFFADISPAALAQLEALLLQVVDGVEDVR